MPVNVLFCEGGPGSYDIKVLNKLLSGCLIRPEGGKYGMGNRIKAEREALRGGLVFGLLDGDFRAATTDPRGQPQPWLVDSGQNHLGWRWERKEIENYFLCYFAGKDLVLAAEEDLKAFGFQGGNAFLAKVIQEIARSTDDIGTWLPEWAALQAAVVGPSLTA